jgi:Spy/CpxP family protein refolding chaperone
MKKTLILAVLFCFTSINFALFAQQNDEKRKENFEKFKAQRKEYISKAMDLTADELEEFWPLCDELQVKKFELNKAIRSEIRKLREAKKEGKTISAADYKKIVELSASVKVKEAQLDEEYVSKFLKILPAEKVYLYQQAEQQFGKEMFGKKDNRPQRDKN